MHYDLHDKNLLLEDLAAGSSIAIQTADERVFFCSALLLKIADFALSRIEVGNDTV